MEFQKLQRIIADVLNISEDKITKESAFVDDRFFRCIPDYNRD